MHCRNVDADLRIASPAHCGVVKRHGLAICSPSVETEAAQREHQTCHQPAALWLKGSVAPIAHALNVMVSVEMVEWVLHGEGCIFSQNTAGIVARVQLEV